tara:strand:- start:364 stop:537 length:174 start_codon:yes stop_codon:yes gene_type:complete
MDILDEKNNFSKQDSYKVLREYTDKKNQVVEPHKPPKKKLHQLFQLKNKLNKLKKNK